MMSKSNTFWKILVGLCMALAILLPLWYFSTVVAYILISAILAVVGRPLVRWLSSIQIRGWQIPRSLSAVLTLCVIWVVGATLLSLLLPLVFHKVHQLATLDFAAVASSIEGPILQLQSFLSNLFSMPESTFSVSKALPELLSKWVDVEAINSFFSSVVGIAFSWVIAILSITFITFFFLRDEGLFYEMVVAVFPEKYQESITHALDSVTVLLSRYISGILSESFLVFTAVSICMSLFGMKTSDACFIGLIMGVMNVVPYAGPFIGGVISLFVGIVTPIPGESVGYTMLVIVGVLLVLKGMDDFILQPTLYSERVKAHPLEIFIVILLAGSMAGILGMLLAIPSYTVIRVFAKEFFSQFRLVRKLTEKI